MKIAYNVEIPRSEAEDINELYKFEESDKSNMKITYDTRKEAITRYSVLKRKIESEEMALDISRIDSDIYVQRVEAAHV